MSNIPLRVVFRVPPAAAMVAGLADPASAAPVRQPHTGARLPAGSPNPAPTPPRRRAIRGSGSTITYTDANISPGYKLADLGYHIRKFRVIDLQVRTACGSAPSRPSV
jgi:hypothetical protein